MAWDVFRAWARCTRRCAEELGTDDFMAPAVRIQAERCMYACLREHGIDPWTGLPLSEPEE